MVARVLVNRVWGWHFGRSIVATPNDFGATGEAPTHPELLDWLARDLVDHGWSLKHLHRRIVLSATYRMASTAEAAARRRTPKTGCSGHSPAAGWRGRPSATRCSPARDGSIAEPFGRPVVPPLGKDELTGLFDTRGKWPVTRDPAEHSRRSVYLLVRRTSPIRCSRSSTRPR